MYLASACEHHRQRALRTSLISSTHFIQEVGVLIPMWCALIALGPESDLVLALLIVLPGTHLGLCLLPYSDLFFPHPPLLT